MMGCSQPEQQADDLEPTTKIDQLSPIDLAEKIWSEDHRVIQYSQDPKKDIDMRLERESSSVTTRLPQNKIINDEKLWHQVDTFLSKNITPKHRNEIIQTFSNLNASRIINASSSITGWFRIEIPKFYNRSLQNWCKLIDEQLNISKLLREELSGDLPHITWTFNYNHHQCDPEFCKSYHIRNINEWC